MGMDVFGKNPTSDEGKYFQRNVWNWRRLAGLACTLAPEITTHCKYWQSNDGDGLNASQSRALADKLEEGVADGTVAEFIKMEDDEIAKLPREKCEICNGTGIRTDDIGEKNGMPDKIVEVGPDNEDQDNPRKGLKGWCNGCNGYGSRRNSANMYGLDIESVAEFAKFLRASGGFQIC